MSLSIVPIYAGILALVYVVLTYRTIKARQFHKIQVGHGENVAFLRISRAHANFSEYAPFILFLMAILELQSFSPLFLHVCGVLLVLSRLVHAYGVSQVKEVLKFRIISMVTTLLLLTVTGLANLYIAISR